MLRVCAAIPTVVTISEILKKDGWVTEKSKFFLVACFCQRFALFLYGYYDVGCFGMYVIDIGTSTVTLKDETKGRVIMKAKV